MKKSINIFIIVILLGLLGYFIHVTVLESNEVKKQALIYVNNIYAEIFQVAKIEHNFIEKKYKLMLTSTVSDKICNIIIYVNQKHSSGKFKIQEV